MNRNKEWIVSIICGSISLLLVRGVWEFGTLQGGYFGMVFPAPSHFLTKMMNSDFQIGLGSQAASLWKSIFLSMYRVCAGLLIGLLSALVVGSAISTSQRLKRFLLPLVQLLAPIAPIAWISMALVLFGIGNSTAIFIVFMGVFFFLVLTTIKAIESTPIRLLYLSKNLGNSSFQTWYRVILPHIMPNIFTMLRINFMAAWMAVLAAEMTGLRDGLGSIIMTGRNLFDYDLILFGMSLIAVFGLLIDIILLRVQRKYFWWDTKVLPK